MVLDLRKVPNVMSPATFLIVTNILAMIFFAGGINNRILPPIHNKNCFIIIKWTLIGIFLNYHDLPFFQRKFIWSYLSLKFVPTSGQICPSIDVGTNLSLCRDKNNNKIKRRTDPLLARPCPLTHRMLAIGVLLAPDLAAAAAATFIPQL